MLAFCFATASRTASTPGEALLEIRGLKKYFPLTQGIVFKRTIGHVRAVDGVDLTMRRGETVGLVGESGCGKSTVSKLLVALEKPTDGQILYKGRDPPGGEDEQAARLPTLLDDRLPRLEGHQLGALGELLALLLGQKLEEPDPL